MPPHIKNRLATLIRDRARAWQEFELLSPALAAQIKAYDIAIEAEMAGKELLYARFRKPSDAVVECLRLHGKPMKKREIAHALLEGGLPGVDPEHGVRLLVDIVRQMGVRKLLQVDGEFVGLPDWTLGAKKIAE